MVQASSRTDKGETSRSPFEKIRSEAKELRIGERLKEEDGSALQDFMCVFGPWLHGMVYRSVRSAEDAEELYQDLLLHVWRKAKLWNPKKG
ncbi:MAG: sigma factor, partial [Patescibacteria group bacterium]